MSAKDNVDDVRRYQAPYSARRPVPTISKYLEEKAARQQEALKHDHDDTLDQDAPYWAFVRPKSLLPTPPTVVADKAPPLPPTSPSPSTSPSDRLDLAESTQLSPSRDLSELRQRRKELKHRKKERAEREVTDPVTHLPVTIHDFTDEALHELDLPASNRRRSSRTKSDASIALGKLGPLTPSEPIPPRSSPPPDYDLLGRQVAAVTVRGLTAGLCGSFLVLFGAMMLAMPTSPSPSQLDPAAGKSFWGRASSALWFLSVMALTLAALAALLFAVRGNLARQVQDIFHDELWDAHQRQLDTVADSRQPETTAWLNSLLGSVWPLINPDLFASLTDTLEDVMQASLPRLVRMVSVEDIGQGIEAIRIISLRWLPSSTSPDSTLASSLSPKPSPGEHGGDDKASIFSFGRSPDARAHSRTHAARESRQHHRHPWWPALAESLEGEDGDFVNMEVAFAYRTRSGSKSLKERTRDIHLLVAFYLPGNVKIPVWVSLQGIVGSMRMRLQLIPDPPFFSLCTVTLLGQPRINLSCMPLSERGLNIMDVPLISNFVQAAVDAAVAEYVAPKSLTIDLKDIFAGDDSRKDTTALGVLRVNIRRGYDFKMGDMAIPFFREGSSDPYVSVGWAKFDKVLWSTRTLMSEMEPCWDETCFVLVTPEELNIGERLRVQLWDSDRFTADDDLGRIEVPLVELMQDERSKGRMWHRIDGFRTLGLGNAMPGRLEWSVGYYPKAGIQQCQFNRQTYDPKVRSMEQLKEKVEKSCERKLREIMFKEQHTERDEAKLERQKAQELRAERDAILDSAPPPTDYPSGILSIQIHNIAGLELKKLNKRQTDDEDEASDEEETGDGLPSSYCTIIINHSKTFRTRTKPQNAKPFFNTGCERFIRDWRECEVFVSVRDARLHEVNPLLGIVHLPLGDVFKERSQVMGSWPLAGGIGHGRIRLSMVWRSVQMQVPRSLLGWHYGTLDVRPVATSRDCPEELRPCKLKVKTNISMGKMYRQESTGEARWSAKKNQNLNLAVHKRYSSCMSIAFKDKGFFGDKVAAFCVLWLMDLPDEEEQEVELPIWKGNFEKATASCLEECGERVGTLVLRLTFWAGMGNAHVQWASRNQHRRDVVEVIETARDLADVDRMHKEEEGAADEAEASSDSDSSDDEAEGELVKTASRQSSEGKQSRRGGLTREAKKRDKALHRQHRGIMQWKVPRTAKWVKHKWNKVGDGVTGLFDHRSKQIGIETEA